VKDNAMLSFSWECGKGPLSLKASPWGPGRLPFFPFSTKLLVAGKVM